VAEERRQHGDHDPELIAALLDRDGPDASAGDRALAERWVAGCADCAALHADLLAVSVATRVLPAPARPRDFRLTAADGARLATAAREPSPTAARLTGVMTDTRDHASHDTLLVASLADRSFGDRDRAAAEALVATCGMCAALHADLLALSAATRDLPAPTRVRDHRLSPEDARRLRPGSWRRLIAAFGSPRDAFSRPLAVGLTTLGIAGLLVATVPSILTQGTGGSATILQTVGKAVGETGTPSEEVRAPAAAAVASDQAAGTPRSDVFGPLASGAPQSVASGLDVVGGGAGETVDVTDGIDARDRLYAQTEGTEGATDQTALAPDPSGLSEILVVSGSLIIVGLGLFALRWTARRLGDG
jgi:hypothetical protein